MKLYRIFGILMLSLSTASFAVGGGNGSHEPPPKDPPLRDVASGGGVGRQILRGGSEGGSSVKLP